MTSSIKKKVRYIGLQEDGRVDTAQNILNEFFDSPSFQRMKQKRDNRIGSIKLYSHSIPLDNTNSPMKEDSKPKATKKLDSILSDRDKIAPKTPGLGIDGQIHLQNLKVDDINVVANVLHRITLQPSLKPGDRRVISTPFDDASIAENIGELQFKNLSESKSVRDMIKAIIDTNKEISKISQTISGYRKVDAANLEEKNKLSLKLFERMMSEVLMMQRNKFRSQTTLVHDLTQKNNSYREDLDEKSSVIQAFLEKVNFLENENDELKSLVKSQSLHMKYLEQQIAAFESDHKKFMQIIEKQKDEDSHIERRTKQEMDKLIKNEAIILQKRAHELEMQAIRKSVVEQSQKKTEFYKNANSVVTTSVFKVPEVNKETQTHYDDFGVWDKQDGWVMLPISGTVVARNRWKKSIQYASCPSCKGTSKFIGQAAYQFKLLTRGEVDQGLSVSGPTKSTEKKKSNLIAIATNDFSSKWRVPDELVRFMSNLPRNVASMKLRPISWIVSVLYSVFNSKNVANQEDSKLTDQVQSFAEHIVEFMLSMVEKRQEAELFLFILLQSVKDVMHRNHPMIHLFARFLGLLDSPTVDASSPVTVTATASQQKKNGIDSTFNANNSTTSNSSGTGKRSGATIQPNSKTELFKISSTSLPSSLLVVYLFARECFLSEYNGEYARIIRSARSASKLQALISKIEDGWGDMTTDELSKHFTCKVKLPQHIVANEQFQLFIPIDRALNVSKTVLSFLSEAQMNIVLRHIEAGAIFLSPSGSFDSADGNHTVIRAAFRRFGALVIDSIKDAIHEKSVDSASTTNTSAAIVVSMDRVLEAMMEMLQSRIKVVENQLRRVFREGDANGDGVLSFKEFKAIVSKTAPHFSKRKILKMYREALMHGNDNDSIHEMSFVHVCNSHGLVQLVDYQQLRKSLKSGPEEQQTSDAYSKITDSTPPPPRRKNPTALSTLRSYVMLAAGKHKQEKLEDAQVVAVNSLNLNSFANVVEAASTMNKLRRQASSTIKDSIDPDVIRRNLSEEVSPSSAEAGRFFMDTLTSRIKRTASEENLDNLKLKTSSLTNSSDQLKPINLPPRFSQRNKTISHLESCVSGEEEEDNGVYDTIYNVESSSKSKSEQEYLLNWSSKCQGYSKTLSKSIAHSEFINKFTRMDSTVGMDSDTASTYRFLKSNDSSQTSTIAENVIARNDEDCRDTKANSVENIDFNDL